MDLFKYFIIFIASLATIWCNSVTSSQYDASVNSNDHTSAWKMEENFDCKDSGMKSKSWKSQTDDLKSEILELKNFGIA